MSRRRPHPSPIPKTPPQQSSQSQVPQLTPQQRLELEQIKGRRERAQYLLRFLNQSPKSPQ